MLKNEDRNRVFKTKPAKPTRMGRCVELHRNISARRAIYIGCPSKTIPRSETVRLRSNVFKAFDSVDALRRAWIFKVFSIVVEKQRQPLKTMLAMMVELEAECSAPQVELFISLPWCELSRQLV